MDDYDPLFWKMVVQEALLAVMVVGCIIINYTVGRK
jgi:hypothetical protein